MRKILAENPSVGQCGHARIFAGRGRKMLRIRKRDEDRKKQNLQDPRGKNPHEKRSDDAARAEQFLYARHIFVGTRKAEIREGADSFPVCFVGFAVAARREQGSEIDETDEKVAGDFPAFGEFVQIADDFPHMEAAFFEQDCGGKQKEHEQNPYHNAEPPVTEFQDAGRLRALEQDDENGDSRIQPFRFRVGKEIPYSKKKDDGGSGKQNGKTKNKGHHSSKKAPPEKRLVQNLSFKRDSVRNLESVWQPLKKNRAPGKTGSPMRINARTCGGRSPRLRYG